MYTKNSDIFCVGSSEQYKDNSGDPLLVHYRNANQLCIGSSVSKMDRELAANMYLYRMLDENGRIIYIGQTIQPLLVRMKQHFSARSHLPEKKRVHVSKIEYTFCKTTADLNLYEAYYVAMWKPQMNLNLKVRDIPTIRLPDLYWVQLEHITSILERDRQYLKQKEDDRKRTEQLADEQRAGRSKRSERLARNGVNFI